MVSKLVSLLTPFSLFGLSAIINRYFNEFYGRDREFLLFIAKWFCLSFAFFTTLYFLVLPLFIDLIQPIFPFIEVVSTNQIAIYFSVLFYSLNIILINFSNTKKRIVVPVLVNKVINVKVLIPLAIISASFFSMSLSDLLWLFNIVFASVFIILFSYIAFNGWTINRNELVEKQTSIKEKLSFGVFGSFNELGMYLAFSIDIVLVYFLLGDTATGFYAIFLFLASVVRLPIDSLTGLFLPIVNTFLRERDYKKIEDYYKRLSKIFFYLSSGIFLMIYYSLNDILEIIKKDNLVNARYIFVFIALGIIINGLTYMNSAIIVQSQYYKWNLFFILLLAILNVIISYYLITDYFPAEHASAGAACGTVISLSIFNILKTLFVYIKFKLFPLSKSTGVILLAFLIGLAITYGLNFDFSPYVNIVLKSAIICLCYFIPIYLIKEVPDVNQLFKSYWTKMKALY